MTRFNTKKVSKSDPEMQAALAQMTLSRLLSTYSGELLRYFILSTHYRRPIEYSTEEIESKRRGLDTFYRLFERIERICGKSPYGAKPVEPAAVPDVFAGEMREYPERFGEAMDDDFNTAAAIAVLFDWANAINRFVEENKLETQKTGSLADVAFWATTRLIETAKLLGLFEQPPKVSEGESATKLATVMELHLAWRAASRAAKNFALADLIRDRINDCGIKVEDRAGGSGWRADLPADEALNKVMQVAIDVRGHCKQNKDFATADRIRDDLAAAGITLEDRADGTIWRG